MPNLIDKINQEQLKKDLKPFKVGDSVRVHTIVKEGEKERVQIFTGIVIGRKGRDINASFTVRRISYGEGVERVFPLHSPRIAKVEVDPDRILLLDVNYTNNSWSAAPRAAEASAKWATRWLTWVQELLLSYAFFA